MAAPKCKHPGGCTTDATEKKDPKTGKGTGAYFPFCSAHAPARAAIIKNTSTGKPDISIKAEEIIKTADQVHIRLEIKTVPASIIRIKHGVEDQPDEQVHEYTGELLYEIDADRTDAKRTLKLRFISETGCEIPKNVDIPAKDKPVTPPPEITSNDPDPDPDPDELQITVWEITTPGTPGDSKTTPPTPATPGTMRAGLHIRVIDEHGKGLPKEVTIFSDNKSKPTAVTLNDQGCGVFKYTGFIPEGKKIDLQAAVSGIKEKASVSLIHMTPPKSIEGTYLERFKSSNNFRAISFFFFLFLLYGITACNLWKAPIFKSESITAPQQKSQAILQYENKVMLMMSTGRIIDRKIDSVKTEPPTSNGSSFLIGACIILTPIVLLYAIFSLREEFAYYMRLWSVNLMRRRQNSVHDPAFERIAKMYGAYGHAKKTSQVITAPVISEGSVTISKVHDKNSFWELLRSDLISDFVMEVALPLLTRTLKR